MELTSEQKELMHYAMATVATIIMGKIHVPIALMDQICYGATSEAWDLILQLLNEVDKDMEDVTPKSIFTEYLENLQHNHPDHPLFKQEEPNGTIITT